MKESYEQRLRRIARLIEIERDVKLQCSKCGRRFSIDWNYDEKDMLYYCPCCGSKTTEEVK